MEKECKRLVKGKSDMILEIVLELVIRYDVDCVHSMATQITLHRIVLPHNSQVRMLMRHIYIYESVSTIASITVYDHSVYLGFLIKGK